MVEPDRPQIRI